MYENEYGAAPWRKRGQWRAGSLGRKWEPWLRIGTSGRRVLRPYAQQSAKRIGEVRWGEVRWYRIVKFLSPVHCILQASDNRSISTTGHVTRLKPYVSPDTRPIRQPPELVDELYLNVFTMSYVTSFWVLCYTLSQCFISGASVYILHCLHLYSRHTTASSPSKLNTQSLSSIGFSSIGLSCFVLKFYIILDYVQIVVILCYALRVFVQLCFQFLYFVKTFCIIICSLVDKT